MTTTNVSVQSMAVCGGVTCILCLSSALGVALPYTAANTSSKVRVRYERLAQLSAGVVIAVSWLHLLDDAQNRLRELVEYPAANVAMLAGFLFTAFFQTLAQCHHHHHAPSNEEHLLSVDASAGGALPKVVADEQTRFYLMEAAISFHSVLIGLGVGFAQSGWREQLVLGLVLCVHQFLEGCALGLMGRRCQLSNRKWVCVFLLFSLSLPAGVATAVGAQLLYDSFEGNALYGWITGLLNGFAAGTLTHVAVDMISRELDVSQEHSGAPATPEFDSAWALTAPANCRPCAMRPTGARLRSLRAMLAICCGAGAMCLLAIWT